MPFPDSGFPAEIEIAGEDYEEVPGGSAVNFCRMLGNLGLSTAFIGMVGEDNIGEVVQKLMVADGIQPELIRRPDVRTMIGFNATNPNGAHIMGIAGTANAALSPEFVLPKLDELLDDARMLYLGGCFKLKSFVEAFDDIARLTNQHSVGLVVDHGRIPGDVDDEIIDAVKKLVAGSTYYFPSNDEFCNLWHVANIDDGLHLLHEQAPQLTTVVKDGKNGAFFLSNDSVQHAEAEKVDNVVNATGAGDSFNAGVMAALLRQFTLEEAVAYGCRVAAAKISAHPIPSL